MRRPVRYGRGVGFRAATGLFIIGGIRIATLTERVSIAC